MHTALCDELGIEFPIFAFTHCRDVVVAVSKAGGFGVLGAVGFTPEQLEIELNWIDEHIGDHPYGVDIVIPNKYEGMDANMSAEELKATLNSLVPQEHLDFAKKILADHGVPTDDLEDNALQLLGWTEATATPQVEIALKHPKMTLIANALGTPPADMIKHIHDAGRKVAALCGSPSQARKHADAGVDIIIAQGGEAGGHSGEVGSIVLWPQVVKEVAPGRLAPPVARRVHDVGQGAPRSDPLPPSALTRTVDRAIRAVLVGARRVRRSPAGATTSGARTRRRAPRRIPDAGARSHPGGDGTPARIVERPGRVCAPATPQCRLCRDERARPGVRTGGHERAGVHPVARSAP